MTLVQISADLVATLDELLDKPKGVPARQQHEEVPQQLQHQAEPSAEQSSGVHLTELVLWAPDT